MTTEQIVEWMCRNYDNKNKKWQSAFGDNYTMTEMMDRFTAKEIIRRIEAIQGIEAEAEETEEQELPQYSGSSEEAENSNKDPLGVRPGEFAAAERIRELLGALERYAGDAPFIMNNGNALNNMHNWVHEINMQLLVLDDLIEARRTGREGER